MFNKRIKGHSVAPSKRPDMVSEDELWEFLESAPDENEGVIYIHVPFCDNICSFCSMNRTKLEDELDDYTKFLLSEIEKYSHLASPSEIKENDYNLNIPRYVDTFEEEELVDIEATKKEISRLEAELKSVQGKMSEYLAELGL